MTRASLSAAAGFTLYNTTLDTYDGREGGIMAATQPAASEATRENRNSWPLRRRLGLGLLILMGSLALLALYQGRRHLADRVACADHGMARMDVLMTPGVRMVYCIDFLGRDVLSGSAVYTLGSAVDDRIFIGDEKNDGFGQIELRRDGDQLRVNGGRPLRRGQSTSTLRFYRQLNPWLLATNILVINNAGINLDEDILMVHGSLQEGWLPGPTGVLLTLLALTLMRRD